MLRGMVRALCIVGWDCVSSFRLAMLMYVWIRTVHLSPIDTRLQRSGTGQHGCREDVVGACKH